MIKHILFDCDGVLIDTEIVAAEVVTNWLNSENVTIDIEEFIREYTGKTFSDIINILKDKGSLNADLDLSLVVPELDRMIRDNQRPIDGVWNMLDSLITPRSVVSNSAKDYVELALEKLEITHHFEGRIYSAEMVAKGKPDPAVYLLALEKLSLTKDEVLVVEDSVAGVVASKAAGLKTIGYLGGSHVRKGHGSQLLMAGVDALVNDHAALTHHLSEY
ncbi:HAD family phosphatase [Roseivirga sp. E12]|uniref:HAD family hydrolase n=1 Tax=Roseivirga sp. E12 TaxID=2819237 RepID=UPI001ABCD3BB|nr:HAD family phosphatase [Roseivirga sp. E12]MBO3698693.1 HAD family phosphatase [Roseivirga sp. E12]